MSAPVHLLPVDDALAEMRLYGTYMALCGALVPASGLPPCDCPPRCECDCAVYCPECVFEAVRYNVEAGQAAHLDAGRYPVTGPDEPDSEPVNGVYIGAGGH